MEGEWWSQGTQSESVTSYELNGCMARWVATKTCHGLPYFKTNYHHAKPATVKRSNRPMDISEKLLTYTVLDSIEYRIYCTMLKNDYYMQPRQTREKESNALNWWTSAETAPALAITTTIQKTAHMLSCMDQHVERVNIHLGLVQKQLHK